MNEQVWMCVDCAMWHANGDSSGMDDETADRVMAAGIDYHVAVGDEEDPFSSRACDICRSHLGGARISGSIFA